MDVTVDMAWLQAYLLVLLRITLFIAIAPPFSNASFPWRIKGLVAFGLAVPFSSRVEVPDGGLGTGALLAAGTAEAATGAVLGVLVMVAFGAVASAGSLIDLASGFQMATVYDPGSMVNGAQFTRLFQNGAIALMLAGGLHIPLFMGLGTSFDAIALGTLPEMSSAAAAVAAAFTGMFAAAAQIAAPLIAILFLADVGLGLLTRVAPTLNAFSLGFPLKILVTLAFGGLVFAALPAALDQLNDSALDLIRRVSG
ncbi:flagellar biosynthetic protein FliR [Citricoccus nitrophenolicus]|uniref:Flagellar biosynthetic protein FliR n=1 Tax=Citricoccus nitrophenolicus TaxID=863575 RepID=A0ABV0II12_9MICC